MPPKQRFTGTIGFAGMDTARFHAFTMAFRCLQLPPGWTVQYAGNYDLAHARNKLVKEFKGDYLFLLDDDHTFNTDILFRLLAHGQPIVGALCLWRKPPFLPCPRDEDGPILLDREPGLVPVYETGGSGLLIHRDVFDAIPWPCFEHGSTADGGHEADDQHFCKLVRDAGFQIYCDTDVILSHLNVASIQPLYEDGEWVTVIEIAGGKIKIPVEQLVGV